MGVSYSREDLHVLAAVPWVPHENCYCREAVPDSAQKAEEKGQQAVMLWESSCRGQMAWHLLKWEKHQDLTSPLQSSSEPKTGTQKGQVWSILCIFILVVWVKYRQYLVELRHAWDLRERAEWGRQKCAGNATPPPGHREKQGVYLSGGPMAVGPMDDRERNTERNPAAKAWWDSSWESGKSYTAFLVCYHLQLHWQSRTIFLLLWILKSFCLHTKLLSHTRQGFSYSCGPSPTVQLLVCCDLDSA